MTAPQRTYWHLQGLGRVPSDYDIKSARLLSYPSHGFAVATPVSDFYQRHQSTALAQVDFESFRDPRETTYTSYVALAREREIFVDGLFRSADEAGADRTLPESWLEKLDAWLPVLLYPCHGLQLAAAYVAQMAPASRVVIAWTFQAADELRRIQRFAYRVRALARSRRGFGQSGKQAWQEEPCWQPLRKVVERLLVTYDFAEALVTLELVVKPMFDRLAVQELGRVARMSTDTVLAKLCFSLGEDARWHAHKSRTLFALAAATGVRERSFLAELVAAKRTEVRAAIDALGPLWPSDAEPWSQLMANADAALDEHLRGAGLAEGSSS